MKRTEKKMNKRIIIKRSIIIVGVIAAILVSGIIMHNIASHYICNEPDTPSNGLHFEPGEKKPIIYLYPTTTTEISVKLGHPEYITCSYPEYKNGWTVIANPDGTLIDVNTGRKLYSLYWEGNKEMQVNSNEGFVVKKENLIEFLEEKLAILGLSETESEEFIIYWLPELQKSEYNFIRFATTDEITEIMPLTFSTEPDTLIRVLMQYKELDNYVEVNEQELTTPKRIGFIAVEWGGIHI